MSESPETNCVTHHACDCIMAKVALFEGIKNPQAFMVAVRELEIESEESHYEDCNRPSSIEDDAKCDCRYGQIFVKLRAARGGL